MRHKCSPRWLVPIRFQRAIRVGLASWIVMTAIGALARESRDITIRRDRWGVPHIFAATLPDGAYGLGYAQAEDRLEQILANYRLAAGRMAEMQGSSWVESDWQQRLAGHEAICRRRYAELPSEVRTYCEAYQDGVRAFLTEHPSKRPLHMEAIEPWMVPAVLRMLIFHWPMGQAMRELGLRDQSAPLQQPVGSPPRAARPAARRFCSWIPTSPGMVPSASTNSACTPADTISAALALLARRCWGLATMPAWAGPARRAGRTRPTSTWNRSTRRTGNATATTAAVRDPQRADKHRREGRPARGPHARAQPPWPHPPPRTRQGVCPGLPVPGPDRRGYGVLPRHDCPQPGRIRRCLGHVPTHGAERDVRGCRGQHPLCPHRPRAGPPARVRLLQARAGRYEQVGMAGHPPHARPGASAQPTLRLLAELQHQPRHDGPQPGARTRQPTPRTSFTRCAARRTRVAAGPWNCSKRIPS